MNRFLLLAIGLLLLLGLLGYATTVNETLPMYSGELITVAENLGIIMMLVNGTFISTRLFKVALFFIGLVVSGLSI